ncbi:uncharacterized protein LOC109787963 [Cajanus cajan]|uniref:Uncharacterized protein n=1 Tax=Cajanus cajan TaxID=3821 RepID=A0A151RD43_CAJCA|nr:uncharacterized protein LOC109787963 [Cajanus cajan]KYP40540.1 hypothetical protein KK1_038139 [Cajanus cajan]
METPSSTARRITRSQTASNNIPLSRKKPEESEKSGSKTRQRNNMQQQQDRCALIDISNDSPIVGLANGNDLETPLSSMAKQRRVKQTPGSGEALLRGQVKTLLQKVEEEAVVSKFSKEVPSFLKLVNSPMSLLAPTPANTPQIANLSASDETALPSAVVEEQLIQRVVDEIFEGKNNEKAESEKSVITRSLLLDFSDKSEVSECSSEVTYQEVSQGSGGGGSTTEDDGASIWSIQVNASTHDEDEDDEKMGEEEEEYYDEDAEDEEFCDDGDGGLLIDELCAGLNNISVNEKGCGKHTRFVYDSDDELVEKVEVESSNVICLKGLPTPKGKHLRFPEEEEDSDM